MFLSLLYKTGFEVSFGLISSFEDVRRQANIPDSWIFKCPTNWTNLQSNSLSFCRFSNSSLISDLYFASTLTSQPLITRDSKLFPVFTVRFISIYPYREVNIDSYNLFNLLIKLYIWAEAICPLIRTSVFIYSFTFVK